ncbi:MAG TPA: DMT family transporter [Candidatus Cloacimonadota bacterium]|nr:DMT family transporter [Candidatus Cloacimonadota bacterium]
MLINNLLLLLTAAIWGFAFVAQRKGMENLDPFTFNALRFALGAICIRLISRARKPKSMPFPWLLGIVLFLAASLQQYGMIYTSAGNAGFITGLYVVFVPLLGMLRCEMPGLRTVLAVALALLGMYLINSVSDLNMSVGNLLVLISALLWAVHVLMVERLVKVYPVLELAIAQFSICAILSAIAAPINHYIVSGTFIWDSGYPAAIGRTLFPLLYGGILSVGIAYTLQLKAQKKAKAAHAAIILCMEGVFALVGGYLILKETMGSTTLVGAALMLGAMVTVSLAQKSD